MALAQRYVPKNAEIDLRTLDLERLIALIASRDEQAATRFYDATSGLLFGLLLLILGDTTTAEQVLLEVYAEVTEHAARFDNNEESLLTWLVTITHRHALEHLCSSSGDQQFLISVGLAAPLASGHARRGIRRAPHRRLVGATLNALSPAEQKMIELAYFSRMTPSAIAIRLRQTPETVKAGLECGVAQLYNLFKQQGFLGQTLTVVNSDRKPT